MLPTPADVLAGARLLWHVPGALRRPLTTADATAGVARQFARRREGFLAMLRRAGFPGPRASDATLAPYGRLLRHAGCEYGDVEGLVRREGVEDALRRLYRDGVYLTVNEFKGRQPVVRGSLRFELRPASLRNPMASPHLAVSTSGSRGRATVLYQDLRYIRDTAAGERLLLAARGGQCWVPAVWLAPGGGALRIMLWKMLAADDGTLAWFSQVDTGAPGIHARYRWSIRAVRAAAAMAGRHIAAPRHVALDDPSPVLDWMVDVLRGGRRPTLAAPVSSAVVLSRAAQRAGINLHGAHLWVTSEPMTTVRRLAIEASGAAVDASYSAVESGRMALGCLAPRAADDMHVLHHLTAMIQAGDSVPESRLPPRAVLVTTLHPLAPLALLNVSLGDEADLTDDMCGCPLERLGWTTHLRHVTSFEKLTARGMTFLTSDVIRVLDEVLPARFGGGPASYQLVERPTADGRAQLRLRVHPSVGAIDDAAVITTFLAALADGEGPQRVMADVWRQYGLLVVERTPPVHGANGKVLHVHISAPETAPPE
jgi:hypothetical protein